MSKGQLAQDHRRSLAEPEAFWAQQAQALDVGDGFDVED